MRVTLVSPQPVTSPQFTSENRSMTANEIKNTFLLALTDFFVVSMIFSPLIYNWPEARFFFSYASASCPESYLFF